MKNKWGRLKQYLEAFDRASYRSAVEWHDSKQPPRRYVDEDGVEYEVTVKAPAALITEEEALLVKTFVQNTLAVMEQLERDEYWQKEAPGDQQKVVEYADWKNSK